MSAVVQETVASPGIAARLPPSLLAGGAMLLLLGSAVLLAPWLVPYDPNGQNFDVLLQAPSPAHPFGTDNFGRDVLTRVLYGAGIDLRIGVLAVIFPFVFGSIAGAVAGYSGGWLDAVVMRTVDVITAVPFLVLVIAVVAFLGPGERNIFIAIGGVGWCAGRSSAKSIWSTSPRRERWDSAAGASSSATFSPTPSRPRSSLPPRTSSWSSSPRPRWGFWAWGSGRPRPSGG